MPLITVREARANDFPALLRLLEQMGEHMYPGRGHAAADDMDVASTGGRARPGENGG
jgi:hypothetical protein